MKQNIVYRILFVTAMAIAVLAVAGAAQAKSPGGCASMESQKAKSGHLKITEPADVGGVTLEPGDYVVKQINSTAGPMLRFTRVTFDPTRQDQSAYAWEQVAQVKVTTKQLCSKASGTKLMLASENRQPIGLEIRGNSVDYLF